MISNSFDSFTRDFKISRKEVLDQYRQYLTNMIKADRLRKENDLIKENLEKLGFEINAGPCKNSAWEYHLDTVLFQYTRINKYHLLDCKKIDKDRFLKVRSVSEHYDVKIQYVLKEMAQCCKSRAYGILVNRINRLPKNERRLLFLDDKIRRMGIARQIDLGMSMKMEGT